MDAALTHNPTTVDEVELGSLPKSLGFLLRMAQIQAYDNFFTDFAETRLKPGEFSVLSVIDLNPGIRQGVLAQRLRIKKAHMTKLVRALETRDIVRRTIPEDDRRSVELTLTAAGREFVDRFQELFREHDMKWPSRLTPAEEDRLAALLRKYLGLDGYSEAAGARN